MTFAGGCKNIQRDVVNIDFICEYIDGEIRTSEESLEVKWVSREDAGNMVTFPLTKKRLENMLEHSGENYCFAFQREPFDIVEEIGVLSENAKGWRKELNKISWNGVAPKYDICDWALEHEKMGKGITLTEEETARLKELL